MSGRATKWIVIVVLPILLALYASYPPTGVVVKEESITEKYPQDQKEADAHDVTMGHPYPIGESTWETAKTRAEADAYHVNVGERYIVGKTTSSRWLPLALGQRDVQTILQERKPDGTTREKRIISVHGRVKLGLDIAGGTELLYELNDTQGQGTAGKVGDTIQILKKRIDPSNVKEYRIQAQENSRILIQVPAATAGEVDALKQRLEKMGTLEFKIAVPRGPDTEAKFRQLYEEADRGQVPEDYVKMYVDGDQTKEYYLVKKGEAAITGRYLAGRNGAYATHDQYGAPAVGFEFGPVGANIFSHITDTYRGQALAIILDGVLREAPVIQERISGRGIIHGHFTQDEVNNIVTILQAGSLPMDIALLQESTVGPQLGRDSINRGLLALAVAGFLVIVFIGIYYIGCGWVADAAVIINLVLLLGVLCILGAALTLPGMAGVLLTVGMAVDANVLIFERIREEQAAGKGVRLALRNGYERAFVTIFDSNVTTLLTGIILYMVGTGPVRGFAVTLCFGIVLSMFTALTVTRLAFETFVDKGWMTRFRMFQFFKQPSIRFSSMRRVAYVGSLSLIVIGMAAFVLRGTKLYDIDFTGGTLVELSLTKPATSADVRARLQGAGFARAEVQGIRTSGAGGGELTDFSVRVKGSGGEDIRTTVIPRLRQQLTTAGLMKAGDTLEMTTDGHGLMLSVADPISETDIRKALGANGDIYSLGNISRIEASDETATTGRLSVHFYDVSALADRRDIWSRALKALAWAEVKTAEHKIQKCDLAADGASVALTLDKPLEWQVLETELARRQFAGLRVKPVAEAAASFTLTGDKAELKRFTQELPAGSSLRSVPDVSIEGDTITATLNKQFPESDIVDFFARQGISNVYVIPLDLKVKDFRLDLSYADVRAKLRAAFADLSEGTEKVTFTPTEGQKAPAGSVLVDMSVQPSMVISTIKHYIEAAGIGPMAGSAIVGEDKYDPATLISRLTLQLPEDNAEQVEQLIAASFGEPEPVQKIVTIGPAVAEELQGKALLAVIFASVIVILYIAARFHAFRFGVAAVIALIHDILITAGMVALADWAGVFGDVKINLAMLAAFLTIMGYSLNDTIVVFDRIRENMSIGGRKLVSGEIIDKSVNQTLSRTVLTSLTTLMVVIVLYLLGGSVLQGLAFTLIIGITVGTYSSVFVASPILLDWNGLVAGTRTFFRILFLPIRLPFRLVRMAFGHGGA